MNEAIRPKQKPKKKPTSQAWKSAERKIATLFGTRRVGPTGRIGPDLYNDRFAVEVKERKSLPQWLTGALDQCTKGKDVKRANNGQAPLIPIVVVHHLNDKHLNDLVVMRLGVFLEMTAQAEQDEVEDVVFGQ